MTKKARRFVEAFDEFHELIVWTLILGGAGLLVTAQITSAQFLIVLGIAFAVMSGFKLRRFKIGKIEVSGDSDSSDSDNP